MALLLASRSFPKLRTDIEFNKGRCNGNQFEATPGLGDYYRGVAESHGVSTTGKYYCSGLADFPGDPTAWVSNRGDVLSVARAKNMTVRGQVEHEGRPVDVGIPSVVVADDILDDEIAQLVDENPDLDRTQIREDLIALRSGSIDPNPLKVEHTDTNYF